MELLAVTVAAFLAVLGSWFLWGFSHRQKGMIPPGPSGFPIVGNLFQLGKYPFITLVEMSKKHGPLMSIRLGSTLAIVVSSPEMAKEVLMKQAFGDRSSVQVVQVLDHHLSSVGYLPVSSRKWKDIRKISREQIFTNHRLDATLSLRQEELQKLNDYVGKRCAAGLAVNIRDAFFTISLNLMSATLFSVQDFEFDSDHSRCLKEAITDFITLAGVPNVVDFFPILERFDPQSVKPRGEMVIGRLLRIVQSHIDQRVEWRRSNPNAPKKNDLLETLIDTCTQGSHFNFDDIPHFLVDLYAGGASTTATPIEWAMTELLLHPEKLSKAKSEVRAVMGEKKVIEDSDISRMPYLQAVINEVLRLYPPGPLMIPRCAEEDITIGNYFIPKGTGAVLNMWAINRDPSVWPNPDSFQPERFLDKNIDYKGFHFELIPFGSGRRICPGLPLAHRVMHETLAALIGNFDWEFPADDDDKHRNAYSYQGLVLMREAPLKAVPLLKP